MSYERPRRLDEALAILARGLRLVLAGGDRTSARGGLADRGSGALVRPPGGRAAAAVRWATAGAREIGGRQHRPLGAFMAGRRRTALRPDEPL